MRSRLAAAICCLFVVLLCAGLAVRGYALQGQVREEIGLRLSQELTLVAGAVTDAQSEGRPVDTALLAELVPSTSRLELQPDDGDAVAASGASYDAGGDADPIAVTTRVEGGELRLSEPGTRTIEIIRGDLAPLVTLLLVLVALCLLGALVLAGWVARPLEALSRAAEGLARGRFEPELPASRVPEVRTLSDALRTAGLRMRDRLVREQQLAETVSHELRTPLTRLRLALEELELEAGDDPRVARALRASLASADDIQATVDDVVATTWREGVLGGVTCSLAELAADVSQRWADRLGDRRTVTASVDGDLDLPISAGPVEHVCELLLTHAVRHDSRSVQLRFEAHDGGPLRVGVRCDGAREVDHADVDAARSVAEAMGGRLQGDDPAEGLELVLPLR